jgi:excinuclease ABC subunit A
LVPTSPGKRPTDLGAEGGDAGGRVIATGTPEQVAVVEESYTGRFLRRVLPAPAAVAV